MKHPYHSVQKRWLIAFLLVSVVMLIGTFGMHVFENMSYLDAFYFISMIATAQGPIITPATPLGKIFAAFMAFLSVGVVVTSLGFVFGPFLGRLFHIGAEHMRKEMQDKKDQ